MSELNLTAQFKNGRTVLTSLYFTTPNKIAKPFYDGPKTKVIVMQASAGLLDGDINNINLDVKEKSRLIYTGQSFTKIFSCPSDKGVVQNTEIKMENDAALFFSPMPVVPFKDSIYKAETKIHLKEKSRLFYSDVFCCGRKERGEEFSFKKFVSRCSVYIEDRIAFLDNTRFFPEIFPVDSIGFFEGYSHTGFIYIYGFECPDFSTLITDGIQGASSRCLKGTVIRIFADDAETINSFITNFSNNILSSC